MSFLLYGYIPWTLIKRIEKKLDNICTRMLILEATKHQLYDHQPPISKNIKIRRRKHVGHFCRSKDEFNGGVLLWTPSHGWESVRRLGWTYLQQSCTDAWYSQEDLPEKVIGMNSRRESRKFVHAAWQHDVHHIYIYIYIYIVRLEINPTLS